MTAPAILKPAARSTNGHSASHSQDTYSGDGMVEKTDPVALKFNGSIWCNLDIALRNLDQLYGQAVNPLGLTIIEWYILRALYEQDGQHASELARAVGRAATSFTPILDKLQNKNLIARQPDPSDRRAVRIYLTETGNQYRDQVEESAKNIDSQIEKLFHNGDFQTFQNVLALLQTISPEAE